MLICITSRKSGTDVRPGMNGGEADPLYTQEGLEATRWRTFLDEFCKRARAWMATKDALTQYRDVLIGRLEETRRVERLRRENAELRFLLQGVIADL